MTEKKENAVVRFYRETVGELRKVSWPTRQEAFSLTRVVLGVLVVMALFLGLVDWIGIRLMEFALGSA